MLTERDLNDNPPGYQKWIRDHDTINDDARDRMTEQIASMLTPPRFSIVMPVYNTVEKYLRSCLDSVRAQVYENWELCISDDASTMPHVRTVLQEYAALDSRIKVIYREENGHISASSNSAIEIATGEYIALVDHDDIIPAHALFCFAIAIQAHPESKILYSDEDHIDENDVRFIPYFKPDFSEELLCGQNFISHFGVYQTSLVRSVGGFRLGLEGSQDWDLALRCVAQVRPEEIRHVPYVLYHWRVFKGSTTFSATQFSKTERAAIRAVDDYLQSQGNGDRGEKHPTMTGFVKLTRKRAPRDTTVEIIRADLAETSRVRKRKTIATRLNDAVAITRSEFILIHDERCEVDRSSTDFGELLAHVTSGKVGCVGAKISYASETLRHAGLITGLFGDIAGRVNEGIPLSNDGYASRASLVQELSAVALDCMMISRKAFDEIGGFDPLTGIYCDVDFCLRLRAAGYKVLYAPSALFTFSGGFDTDTEDDIARQVMRLKWGNLIDFDPFFNPNLTIHSAFNELSYPPRQAPAWASVGHDDIDRQPRALPGWIKDETARDVLLTPVPKYDVKALPPHLYNWSHGEVPSAGQDY